MKLLKSNKGFSLLEALVVIGLLGLAFIGIVQTMHSEVNKSFDIEKSNYAQRISFNYLEAIDNIRTSAWLKAYMEPPETATCSSELDIDNIEKYTPDLQGWFCQTLSGNTGETFADLNGTYQVIFDKDPITNESNYKLSKSNVFNKPMNIEHYGKYTVYYKDNREMFGNRKKKLIDFEDNKKMELLLKGKHLDIGKYNKYMNNNKTIPGRVFLITVNIESGTDEDVKNFKDDEKEFYKKQIKRVKVKVEYSDLNGKRRTIENERVLTNFRI